MHIKKKHLQQTPKIPQKTFSQSKSRTTKTIKKGLFNLVNRITYSKTENPMPLDKSPEELVEEFATFLSEKIGKIHDKFKTILAYQPKMIDTPLLTKFSPLTKDKIYKEIMEMKNMSCEPDTICPSVLKQLLPVCIDTIIEIVNLSLTSGNF